jgi:hypothetical protein
MIHINVLRYSIVLYNCRIPVLFVKRTIRYKYNCTAVLTLRAHRSTTSTHKFPSKVPHSSGCYRHSALFPRTPPTSPLRCFAMNCSKNCIRTTWKAPLETKSVAGNMLEILNSYPQEGQSDIDKGGWTIASGDLITTGKTRVEYKSGSGIFSKILNGGKPFIDDLEIEVSGNMIEIQSASRMGMSDFGVNQKRLQFLASKARGLGWEAPDPKY